MNGKTGSGKVVSNNRAASGTQFSLPKIFPFLSGVISETELSTTLKKDLSEVTTRSCWIVPFEPGTTAPLKRVPQESFLNKR